MMFWGDTMMDTSSSWSVMSWAKTILSAVGSLVAATMVFRSMAYNLFPDEVWDYFNGTIKHYLARLTSRLTVVMDEYEGLSKNQVYEAAQVVFSNRLSTDLTRVKVSKPEKQEELSVSRETNRGIVDKFNGVELWWIHSSKEADDVLKVKRDGETAFIYDKRSFELSFHRKHKDMVINSYLPHLVEVAAYLKRQKRTLKLFTNQGKGSDCEDYDRKRGSWTSVNLDHPATFETLAMEPVIKQTILDDLDQFVKRRDYYRRVGKAWKRGYLLHGPPGTGKSSLVAAMANYLKFDIYDLELTSVRSNSELRKVLVETANRSILVVEDIDCSIQFHHRPAEAEEDEDSSNEKKKKSQEVTLSGMLNFMDGLWSSCGDERIIVFTTNHKEKLDPALLRPGRMDVHVLMSYCTPCGFRDLAFNYLHLRDHLLFGDIEDLLKTMEVTPAEVAEQLLRGGDKEPDALLADFIEFLKEKKKANEELKDKKIPKKKRKARKNKKKKIGEKEIQDLIRSTTVTRAEMAEQLLNGRGKPIDAFMDMIKFLKEKKKTDEELAAASPIEDHSD